MKTFFLTTLILISIVSKPVIAQEKFTVPNLTDFQKFQIASGFWKYAYCMMLSVAKASGKSIEEASNYVGEQNIVNKEIGFEGMVKIFLIHCVIFVPDGNVTIIEQTDKMIKVKLTNFFPELKNGSISNVTYDEWVKSYDIALSKAVSSIGATSSFKDTPEGIIAIIQKQ